MRFTLKSLLLLPVVLASALAAFGASGILATVVGVALGFAAASRHPSGQTTFHACVASVRAWFHVLKTDRAVRTRWLIGLAVVVVLLILLCLPRLQEVRTPPGRPACPNNLKQIGISLHNYHDDYGCFPPAYVVDQQGNRMHSWRTLIAPYCEEIVIANVYDFNEPWDGPKNRNAAATPLSTLRCPQATGKNPAETSYVAVTGPGTAWPGEKSTRIADFTDGLPNTILLVELADTGILWTEPRDLTIDQALGSAGASPTVPSSRHAEKSGYFFREMPIAGWVLMGDGSVRRLPCGLSRDDLAALLRIDDGGPVGLDNLLTRREPSVIESLRWDHCIGLPAFVTSLVWLWIRLLRDAEDNAKTEPRP